MCAVYGSRRSGAVRPTERVNAADVEGAQVQASLALGLWDCPEIPPTPTRIEGVLRRL